MQSGAENNLWSVNYPDSSPENYIFQVATNLACPTEDTAAMLTCIRAASARELRLADSLECTVSGCWGTINKQTLNVFIIKISLQCLKLTKTVCSTGVKCAFVKINGGIWLNYIE